MENPKKSATDPCISEWVISKYYKKLFIIYNIIFNYLRYSNQTVILLPGQEDKNLGKLKISNKKNSKKYFFL